MEKADIKCLKCNIYLKYYYIYWQFYNIMFNNCLYSSFKVLLCEILQLKTVFINYIYIYNNNKYLQRLDIKYVYWITLRSNNL